MFTYIKQLFINNYYKYKLINSLGQFVYIAHNLGSYVDDDTFYIKKGLKLSSNYVLIWTLSREFMGGEGYILTKNDTTIVKNYNIDPYIKKCKYKNIYLDIIDDLKLKEKEYLEKRYSINNILK